MPSATSRKKTQPLVLSLQPLSDIVLYLLAHSCPCGSTVVICASRDDFVQNLCRSLHSSKQTSSHFLQTPTLALLAQLQSRTLVFCADVPTLRAYLASLTAPNQAPFPPDVPPRAGQSENGKPDIEEKNPFLVLVNPLALHRPTPSFSAQGLGRTIAAAVEAAAARGQRLVLAESSDSSVGVENWDEADREMRMDETAEEEQGAGPDLGNEMGESARTDPWQERIPILDVIVARKFGGQQQQRPWVGRTVSARRVVERWARFEGSE